MLIDCEACVMKGPGCQDCVVTVVLGFAAERSVTMLIDDDYTADSGLVPPLRLVHAVSSVDPNAAAETPAGEGETAVGSG